MLAGAEEAAYKPSGPEVPAAATMPRWWEHDSAWRRRAGGAAVGGRRASLEARGAAVGVRPLGEEALARSVSPPSVPSIRVLSHERRRKGQGVNMEENFVFF